jgi:hypothetical protein
MVTLRLLPIIFGVLLLTSSVRVRAQNSPEKGNGSWTTTTQTAVEDTNPTRTTETYTSVGNRTIHKMRTEVLGPGGSYEAYSERETETIQEDVKSSHTIVRSYSPGFGGEMQLIELTEEKRQQLPGGTESMVRTISNPDEYGSLKVVQREIGETNKLGSGSEETQSTLYTEDVSGTLLATTKIREEKKTAPDGSVQTRRTTSAPDLGGTWQVTELVQGMEKNDGHNRTTESSTQRPDFEGKLSEVSHTISKQSQADGQVSNTTQTYSPNVPGVSPDGRLHLVERTTTPYSKKVGGTALEQQVEYRDPGDGNLKVMMTTSSSVVPGSSGKTGITTTSGRGLDGAFSIVSSETSQTTQIPMQVQISHGDQDSANPQK